MSRTYGHVIHGLGKKYVENCKRSTGNLELPAPVWDYNVEIDLN